MRYDLDFAAPLAYWRDLLVGAATTLGLSVTATVLGFGLGVLCAIARTGRSTAAAGVVGAYVEAIRNTPLLVQIFIVYFGLASVGRPPSALRSAVGTCCGTWSCRRRSNACGRRSRASTCC